MRSSMQPVTRCHRKQMSGHAGFMIIGHKVTHPEALPPSGEPKRGTDAELYCVLSTAVEELGLQWSPPEEPTRRHLDEWFLPGRRQASRQWASPFFPKVHKELTRLWHAPTGWVCGSASLSAHCHRLVAKAAHPSKPWRTTSALAGLGASPQGGPAGLSGQTPPVHGRVWPRTRSIQRTVQRNWPLRTTKITAQAIGRSIAGLVVLERHR